MKLDELQDLLRTLLTVCEALDQLDSPEYPATVGKHSRAEIHSYISGARYQGQRVNPNWSKSALVEAYIAINRRGFEGERERLASRSWPIMAFNVILDHEGGTNMGSTLLRVHRANDARIERETALTTSVFPQWITAHICTPLMIKYLQTSASACLDQSPTTHPEESGERVRVNAY